MYVLAWQQRLAGCLYCCLCSYKWLTHDPTRQCPPATYHLSIYHNVSGLWHCKTLIVETFSFKTLKVSLFLRLLMEENTCLYSCNWAVELNKTWLPILATRQSLLVFKGPIFLSKLLDDKMLHVMRLWLKRFVDWLRGWCCNGNINFHFVCVYIVAYLMLNGVSVCKKIKCVIFLIQYISKYHIIFEILWLIVIALYGCTCMH